MYIVNNKEITINIRFSEEEVKELDRKAKEMGTDRSGLIRMLVRGWGFRMYNVLGGKGDCMDNVGTKGVKKDIVYTNKTEEEDNVYTGVRRAVTGAGLTTEKVAAMTRLRELGSEIMSDNPLDTTGMVWDIKEKRWVKGVKPDIIDF
jgi:hypothetical protein